MGLITSLPAAQGVFHPLGKALLSRNWHFPPTNKNQAGLWVAVGTGVASGPPHRSEQAVLPHSALILSSGGTGIIRAFL